MHLGNVRHLDAYIVGNALDSAALSSRTVAEFFRGYPAQARNRVPDLNRHIANAP